MKTTNGKPVAILTVGLPGSGKSTYAANADDSYTVLSRDELTTRSFRSELKKQTDDKCNIVIDQMNLSLEKRMSLISELIIKGYQVKCVYCHCIKKQSISNVRLRTKREVAKLDRIKDAVEIAKLRSKRDQLVEIIPKLKLEKPCPQEGFSEIVVIVQTYKESQ
ncbi:MAG: ATP-binding protein [Lentisphaeraceae bacterium]|nr:ATP-binding protein [Lentisphaeraceae bacterium]